MTLFHINMMNGCMTNVKIILICLYAEEQHKEIDFLLQWDADAVSRNLRNLGIFKLTVAEGKQLKSHDTRQLPLSSKA